MTPTVGDMMTAAVFVVRDRETVGEVRRRMLRQEIHALPVVDDDTRPVGIVTSTDLLEDCDPDLEIRSVMSPHIHTVARDAPVAGAARAMRHRHIHHLVVTDGSQLVGILSALDLLRLLED